MSPPVSLWGRSPLRSFLPLLFPSAYRSTDRDLGSSEFQFCPRWKHDLELVTSSLWASISKFRNLMGPKGFLGVCDLLFLTHDPLSSLYH